MRAPISIALRLILSSVMLLVVSRTPCGATTASVVHAFSGPDGKHPMAGVFLGADGKLYGTTANGGSGVTSPAGTVFRVATNGDFASLYTFDFQLTGDTPFGGIVADGDGNLYGTTRGTGAYLGNVFKLGPSFTNVHGFGGYFGAPADGSHPESGLVLADDGNFYGTTLDGGGFNIGTVYRVGTDGTYAMIHSFGTTPGVNEGNWPRGALAKGPDGNLYGTTSGGGPSGSNGTVFKVTTAGDMTTLHTFVGTDGSSPPGTLLLASDGNFYGTTSSGGAHGLGTVFRISASGDFASLYSFGDATGDGTGSAGGLIQASDGYLYGTNPFGGDNGLGTVYRMSLGGTPVPIYPFAFHGPEGFDPRGALIEGPGGDLYGTTTDGGNPCSCGTVFRLTLSAPTSTSTSSTTSSTEVVPTTTSTPMTAHPTTTTSTFTTSTAVGITLPTTTTTLPLGCAAEASGPTFASIRCRLVALRDQVNGEPGLGSYAPKLLQNIDKAIERLDDALSHCAAASGTKKAKSRLAQVKKALVQYVHRLNGHAAKKKLDPTLRQTFVDAGAAITPDVTMLRAQLVCPVTDAA